jgi:hypothetical protein
MEFSLVAFTEIVITSSLSMVTGYSSIVDRLSYGFALLKDQHEMTPKAILVRHPKDSLPP